MKITATELKQFVKERATKLLESELNEIFFGGQGKSLLSNDLRNVEIELAGALERNHSKEELIKHTIEFIKNYKTKAEREERDRIFSKLKMHGRSDGENF